MLRRVVLVRTDVSGELRASFIRVTRIGQLGTTLAATGNKSTQHNISEDDILQNVTILTHHLQLVELKLFLNNFRM
jgi:hypothetical protein